MDDVKAMTRAGETVGKAVGSGWLVVRRGAKRAGQASADATIKAAHAADRKLTERGAAPQQLAVALAEGAEVTRQEVVKTTRRARKKLARKAKQTRKDLAKAAKQARKDAKQLRASLQAEAVKLKTRAREEAAALKLMEAPKKRRRWPKVMLLVVVAAGVAYVVRSMSAQPEEPPVTEPRHRADTPEESANNAQSNGQAAKSPTKQQG
jgi:vacuolar-type H+-ATPase subunit I/STV1